MSKGLITDLAQKVSDYFGDKPIPPYLDADLELRDAARKILGVSPIPAWKEGDAQTAYEGHKLHCPKCGWECIAQEVE